MKPSDSSISVLSSHAQPAEAVIQALNVDPLRGLSNKDVSRQRARYGRNQLKRVTGPTPLQLALSQFRNPVVYLLGAAAFLALFLGDHIEAIAILIVLGINATIGFATEWRARRSMDALRDLSVHEVTMRRNGDVVTLPADELVPGDIVLVEAGNMLAADMRILESAGLASDESALTGESVPVMKSVDAVDLDRVLAERNNMLFKGCAITSGTGEAVVTATGMLSELGHITQLVASSEASRSPLEDQLASLSRDLMVFTLLVTALVGIAGMLGGRELTLMVKSAVALAVATIPEGLPIVATLALARGMRRMAKRNALIEQLSAVETLGATTLIMTDKTGTLTENRMQLARVSTVSGDYDVHTAADNKSQLTLNGPDSATDAESVSTDESASLHALLLSTALCSNANLANGENPANGDPMEIALLEAAAALGHERQALLSGYPEVREIAFDSTTRRMATVHRKSNHQISDKSLQDESRSTDHSVNHDPGCTSKPFYVAVKGAPEAVFDTLCDVMGNESLINFDAVQRSSWKHKSDALASDGLRVLAIARKQSDSEHDAFEQLTLYGLVGFRDPPRADIADTIDAMQGAGVSVVMVTGDHVETARHIAHEIGMIDSDGIVIDGKTLTAMGQPDDSGLESLRKVRVFSRVSPEQKLQLISLHQDAGDIVGMLGDGINDAPALKKADIGVAMGQRGTQVAKDAADMVLRDDAFSTLIHAIREGRLIFTNIRRFSVYLLSCNLSEILVIGIAVLVNLPLPLLPLQILFLNLVTDVFPAFALGTIAAGRDVLERAPRPPSENILGAKQWRTVVVHGCSIALATFLGMFVAMKLLHLQGNAITTLCFYTLALAQLWLAFAMHNWREHLLRGQIILNPYVWSAVALCLLLLLMAALIPPVSSALQFESLDRAAWAWVLGLSVIPLVLRECATAVFRLFRRMNQTTVDSRG